MYSNYIYRGQGLSAKEEQLQFEQLRLKVNSITVLTALDFSITVTAKLQKINGN